MSRVSAVPAYLAMILLAGLAAPAAVPAAAVAQPAQAAASAHPFDIPPEVREMTAEERSRVERLWRSIGYYTANGGHSNALDEIPELAGLLAQTYGADHPISIWLRLVQAGSLGQTLEHEAAERLFSTNIEALQRRLPQDAPPVLGARFDRAANFIYWGRPADAAPLLESLVPTIVARFGERSAEHARALATLAWLREAQGRYAEAERLAREALAIREGQLEVADPLLASTRARIASTLTGQGEYDEARVLLDSALAAGEREDGGTARLIEARGDLALAEGRLIDAERDFRRAGEIFVAAAGFSSPEAMAASSKLRIAIAGNRELPADWNGSSNLPIIPGIRCEAPPRHLSELWEMRVEAAATPFVERSIECRRLILAFLERQLGQAHPETAGAMHDLGESLHRAGRTQEAEALVRQALTHRLAALGEPHPRTMRSVALLGELMSALGRSDEANALAARAAGGDGDDVSRLRGLMQQAQLLDSAGRFAEAEAIWAEVDRGYARTQDLAAAVEAITGFTFNKVMRGRCEDIRHEELSTAAQTLRSLNPVRNAVTGLSPLEEALAQSEACRGQWESAARRYADLARVEIGRIGGGGYFWSRETALLETRRALVLSGHPSTLADAEAAARTAAGISRERRYTMEFDGNRAVGQLRFADGNGGSDPLAAAFVAQIRTQWALVAQGGGGAAPLDITPPSVSERIAGGADAAELSAADVQARAHGWTAFEAAQDLGISAAAQSLLQAAARATIRDPALVELVRRQQALSGALAQRERALFAGGGGIDPSALAELERDRAELESIGQAIRQADPEYAELVRPGAIGLREVQGRLRPGEALVVIQPAWNEVYVFAVGRDRFQWHRLPVDTATLDEQVRQLRCLLDGASCRRGESSNRPYDLALAHQLYRELLLPVEPALAGANQLFVVASGSMSGLPLGLLVAEPAPPGADDPLRAVGWLTDRYALVTLPSVSSLRAFQHAGAANYGVELAGYGDPALGPPVEPDPNRAAVPQRGGGLADVATLRTLASLPGTRRELLAMAAALDVPESALRFRESATERAVRQDDALERARVVVFATHGLLPREMNGFQEPGLVFTPPAAASAQDDGILTASEAAALDLAAQWVILSACNTAAADGRPGGESLSGLARSFLYAGARSLLASHWQVSDDATAALTVEAVRIARARPELSRAQAMQAAMRTVRTGETLEGGRLATWDPAWADPWFWAPFVLIESGS